MSLNAKTSKTKIEKDDEKEDTKGKAKSENDEDEDAEDDEKEKSKGKSKVKAKGKVKSEEDEDEDENAEEDEDEKSAKAQLARVRACESLNVPGYENFIASKKWEKGMTKEKLASLILEDQENKRAARSGSYREDGLELAKHSAKIGNTSDLPKGTGDQVIFDAMLAGANSRRA